MLIILISFNVFSLVHSDYNYEYDENNKLTFEGVYNGGKISAACFTNSPEEIRRIQKQITNWGVSYNYNVHSIVRNMGIPRYNY